MDVQGKAALIMGGGSGIGRAVALTLASHGASVAIGDLVAERAEQVAGERRPDSRAWEVPWTLPDRNRSKNWSKRHWRPLAA